jgi:hypothetical protein
LYLTKEIDILFPNVLYSQIRWFKTVVHLAIRHSQTPELWQYRYRNGRGENDKEKIYNIAEHVVSRVNPAAVHDSTSPFASTISPLG